MQRNGHQFLACNSVVSLKPGQIENILFGRNKIILGKLLQLWGVGGQIRNYRNSKHIL